MMDVNFGRAISVIRELLLAVTSNASGTLTPALMIPFNRPIASSSPATYAASTPASDSKLSWQEQKEQQARERKRKNELKKTEEEIAKLEDRNTEIDEELTKEEVYSNSIECQKLSTERAANEARLEELYELWEELAE